MFFRLTQKQSLNIGTKSPDVQRQIGNNLDKNGIPNGVSSIILLRFCYK